MENTRNVPSIHEGSFFSLGPKDIVARAAMMAEPLNDVIRKQKLFSTINGKDYVKVEGWQTLGNMLGILPRDTRVIEHVDGSFEAYVDLVNYQTGMVVGGGSALCGMDERRWKTADRFARRSMAITRATGKAYRLSFGWIMTMSGYESTPAEEMPEIIEATAAPVLDHYDATPLQKKILSGYLKKCGITGIQEQIEIATAIKEKRPLMADLILAVDEYLKNPLGAN